MKFIIDAQLPKSIGAYFHEHDVIHTSELEEGNRTKDKRINSLSILESRILITKDNDFYYSYIAARKPLTAWRCGGILCSVCRQLKPNKDIKFDGSNAA